MKFNVNFQCNVKFNEVTMIYNALSVSGIQQSDCLYMHLTANPLGCGKTRGFKARKVTAQTYVIGASQVAQWQRIRLPMQEMQV